MNIPATHDDLCEDLAAYLRQAGYKAQVEVRRAGVWTYGDAGRVDVLAMLPWRGKNKFEMIAFEVKRMRSDFLSDVTSGKWRRYHAEYGIPRTAFAVLEGVAKLEDVPADAGLYVRGENGWKRKRAGRPMSLDCKKIDPLLLISLLSQESRMGRRGRSAVWDRTAESLPLRVHNAVAKAIEGLGDDDVRRWAMGVGAKMMALELSARMRRGDPVQQRALNTYVDAVLDLCAQFSGVDAETLKTNIGRYSGDGLPYDPLLNALRDAVAFARRRDVAKRLMAGAEAVMGGGYHPNADDEIRMAEDSLAKIEADHRAYDDAMKPPHRHRKSA